MESAKNATDKILCRDCKKKIEITGKKIKNGYRLLYKSNGENIEIFKCANCFGKNKKLSNFQDCEVYSRIVGYIRPVNQWHKGKQQEFKERKEFLCSSC